MEQFLSELRLGDVIDDHCIKCRRVTNHSIVSLVDGKAAKVRCRTCYHDHDYRNEQAPPSKKDLKKAELFKEVLGAVAPEDADAETSAEELPLVEDVSKLEAEPETIPEPVVPPKKSKARGKRA
ncbi:MAG: hypothetical protein ACR2NN_20390 [Bryobacteraceae bacterium]